MKTSHLFRVLALSSLGLILAACADSGGMAGKSALADLDIPAENLRPVNYSIGSGGPEKLADLAVTHNPSIKALRHKAERMEAQAPQAASLPDPMASLSAGSMAETAAGRVEGMVGVSQKIPLPGKRAAASKAASLEAAAIRSEADTLALKISEQVKSAWWDYYLADQTIAFTRENRGLLTTIRDVVSARLEANAAAQTDQIRIENEITTLDRDLLTLEQVRSSAKARINSLLNRPAGASIPPPSALSIPATGSLEKLIARAEANHPDIRAAQSRVDAFGQRLKKAKLERFPDPTIGLTYAPVSGSGLSRVSNGRDQVFATLGFNIPLWQEPRKAMVREASEGIAETRAMLQSSRSAPPLPGRGRILTREDRTRCDHPVQRPPHPLLETGLRRHAHRLLQRQQFIQRCHRNPARASRLPPSARPEPRPTRQSHRHPRSRRSLMKTFFKSILRTPRKILTVAIPLALFLIGWWFGLPSEKRSADSGSEASQTTWACSMHPQIRQPNPGLCPICAMDLIPLEATGSAGLREVSISPEASALLDIRVSPVVALDGNDIREIPALGRIAHDERSMTSITARIPGRIDSLFVDYTGAFVIEGEALAELYSPEIYLAQKELIEARDAAKSPVSNALYKAALRKLELLEISPQDIAAVQTAETPSDRITIRSPQAGQVTEKKVVLGSYVKTGDSLFTIADHTTVWLNLEIQESDLARVIPGLPVEFTIDSLPGEKFSGNIAYVDHAIDPRRRFATARLDVPNPLHRIKPGMFASARILAPAVPYGTDAGGLVTVPESAVLRTGDRAIVYVRTSDPDPTFEGREILLGSKLGSRYVVRQGLSAGETVVTKGAFKLDSEL